VRLARLASCSSLCVGIDFQKAAQCLGASPAGCLGLGQFQRLRLISTTLVDNRDARCVSVTSDATSLHGVWCFECSTLGAWSIDSKVAVVAAPFTSDKLTVNMSLVYVHS
jgi:hypothetical protein